MCGIKENRKAKKGLQGKASISVEQLNPRKKSKKHGEISIIKMFKPNLYKNIHTTQT